MARKLSLVIVFLALGCVAPTAASAAAVDGDIWWNEVLHDQSSEFYRYPQHPVTNSTIHLRLLTAGNDLTSARVRVWSSATQSEAYFPMARGVPGGSVDEWEATIPTGSTPGSLWYFFELNDTPDQDFYTEDDTAGGTGVMRDSYTDQFSFGTTVSGSASNDGSIWWDQVMHDSRYELYRNPRGYLYYGEVERVRLRVAKGDITGARVRVWNGKNQEAYYNMFLDTTVGSGTPYDFWFSDIPSYLVEPCFWYYFEINDGDDTDYYTDDYEYPHFSDIGGKGMMRDSYDDSHSFFVSVLRSGPEPPSLSVKTVGGTNLQVWAQTPSWQHGIAYWVVAADALSGSGWQIVGYTTLPFYGDNMPSLVFETRMTNAVQFYGLRQAPP